MRLPIPGRPMFFCFQLLILSHCCWIDHSGSCVVSSSSAPLPPLAFLDDTMQGMSGRKLRLEGGETLQSSPVTMRWFSCRSLADRPPLYPPFFVFCFPSWVWTQFLISLFHIYSWWLTGLSANNVNTHAFLSCLGLLCWKGWNEWQVCSRAFAIGSSS